MAEREIYRVEIPIIVDDQTDAPLKQAERKISKFEKSAQMETERIRKHFQHIAKYQIEPVMKVRDQLTANVLKADKLIRKLDLNQASPLIAAQDRVSAVVTRINAMLDALDKGKVDVVAEMQGPLLDEIIKAKKSLSELNNVKAGPIAELRGQLFGQLTKAMSQIKGLDLTRAEPQATLRERVTWKVKEVSSRLRGLTSRVWTVTLKVKDKVTDTVKNIMSKVTSPLALLGAGAGLGAGIFFPLKLAGEMEQAGIAMEFFTESAAKGQKFLKELQTFAAKTPFEFPDVRDAAVGLMPIYKQMYGVDEAMKQTMRTIAAFGDAAGLTGAGIQGMNLALLGFRQIGTIGKLSMEELRQVTENLMIPMNIILDELGLTGDALDNLAKEGIEAKVAMEAIVRALEKHFSGGMEKMSRSLLGLTSTIKDTATLTVWHFGAGMAEPVRRILLDVVGLTDETGGKFEEFQRRLERAGEQVGLKFEQMYGRLKEFWASISADPEFQKLDFGDKIIYVLNLALDEVSAWLDSEGGMKLQETFTKLGEIGAKAWIAGLKGAFKGAVSSAAHGNLVGAGAMLGLASMLGGGLVLRGAWGLGKGLFGAGKWALGKLGLGSASATAAGVAAETTATAGRASIAGRVLPILGRARPWLGRIGLPIGAGLEAINIARAEDKRTAVISGTGRIAGMIAGGKAGAAVGGAVGGLFGGVGAAPGAAIGGILGGIGGLFGGEKLAEKINAWLDKVDFKALKEKALLMWDDVGQKASDTWENVTAWASGAWEEARESASSAWNWIKENFTLESIAEKAGYVVGYLESTIFSGEWWGRQWDEVKNWASEKWASMVEVYESAKATIMSTIFSSEWWLEKWENVKAWAADKWAAMSEVWENTKEILNSTIFSSEWWLEKWDNVKSWASEKWDEMKTVWETAKEAISSTLFSKDWWRSKWENVKTWASGVLDDITARWESIKESFQAGREAGQRAAATKYAVGGILTRPHLGLVAEAGPEAIIPLSAHMRPRALELWQQTGELLGVRPYAEGGFAGPIPALAPVGIPSVPTATINMHFDLAGLVGQVVVNNQNEIESAIDTITGAIADNLRGIFQNMTRK